LQYELHESGSRMLINAALMHNVAYRLYEHRGSTFLVTQVPLPTRLTHAPTALVAGSCCAALTRTLRVCAPVATRHAPSHSPPP
jgi:hypothetical protein